MTELRSRISINWPSVRLLAIARGPRLLTELEDTAHETEIFLSLGQNASPAQQ